MFIYSSRFIAVKIQNLSTLPRSIFRIATFAKKTDVQASNMVQDSVQFLSSTYYRLFAPKNILVVLKESPHALLGFDYLDTKPRNAKTRFNKFLPK